MFSMNTYGIWRSIVVPALNSSRAIPFTEATLSHVLEIQMVGMKENLIAGKEYHIVLISTLK